MSTAPDLLSRIRIVLVNAQHPGNIGSAARAMKNMGLADLALVKPLLFPHEQATALAAGADDVLEAAQVFPSVREAVSDCAWVVGTSARLRTLPMPTYTPRELAELLRKNAVGGRVALLFGAERIGLTNDELDLCQALVSIPTASTYSSLNLSAAVQVLSYELRLAADAEPAGAAPHVPAAQVQMEGFFEHLERVVKVTGFLDAVNPRQLMRKLRRVYGRAMPDEIEVNILRGILTSVEERFSALEKSPDAPSIASPAVPAPPDPRR
jgi:TrmH family RNA methyltransferase